MAGDEYPKSPLPEITCEAEVNEVACVLTSFSNESGKSGVDAICDETEVVDIGAKAVADMSGANNDDDLFVLASASCLCQETPPKKPAKRSNLLLSSHLSKNGKYLWWLAFGKCCNYETDGPLHHLLPENFPDLRILERKCLQTEKLKKSRRKAKDDKLKKKGTERKVALNPFYHPHPEYPQYSLYPPDLLPPMPYYPWGAYSQQHMYTSGVNVSTTDSNGSVIQRLTQENAQLKDKISKLKSLLSKNK